MADIADLQLLPFDEAKPKIVEALKSEDWTHRYWGAMACTAHGKQAGGLRHSFPAHSSNGNGVRNWQAVFSFRA